MIPFQIYLGEYMALLNLVKRISKHQLVGKKAILLKNRLVLTTLAAVPFIGMQVESLYLKLSISPPLSCRKEVSPKSLETPLFTVSVTPGYLLFLSNPVCPLMTQSYRTGLFDRLDDLWECRFPVNS